MSVLSKLSIDEVRNRVPDRLANRPRRTSTGLRAQLTGRATAGWDAARAAARSAKGETERRWPKRAGIVAAAAGAVGGAVAFVKRIRSHEEEATSDHAVTQPQTPGETVPSATNGTASKVEAVS